MRGRLPQPRLRPRQFYHLVIEIAEAEDQVAIGGIQLDLAHHALARRLAGLQAAAR